MKIKCLALISACAIVGAAFAQNTSDLTADHKTAGDVLTYGMGYNNQRYSALTQINKDNVGKLSATWAYSLNNPQSHESQPIVHDGMMYINLEASCHTLTPYPSGS